jgi:hypothetical protein
MFQGHRHLAPPTPGVQTVCEPSVGIPIFDGSPPSVVSFMPTIPSKSGRLHSEFVKLLFLQTHRETDRFFAVSGVHLLQSTSDQFHFRRTAFDQQFKNRVALTLTKAVVLRITLNLDGSPITSHSETSRLLTSSFSLGIPVPVPRSTQCIRDM